MSETKERGRSLVFDEPSVATMRQMAAEGKTAGEIAKAIGSTGACVSVMCSRYQIPLGRSGAFTIRVSETTRQALIREAERRGNPHVGDMIRRILTIIANDKLFDAVLGEPKRGARN
jgi:hypothetical protein